MSRRYSDEANQPEDGLSEAARKSGQTAVRRTTRSTAASRDSHGSGARNSGAHNSSARNSNQHHSHGEMYDIDAIFEAREQPRESYSSRLQATDGRRRSSRVRQSGAERSGESERTSRASARASARAGARSGFAAAKPRRKGRIILICALVVVGVAVASVAGYFITINNNLHEGVDDSLRASLVKTDMANEPFYLLLMGTDGSAEREESEEYGGGGFRSDTIILARVDAPKKKATLVSIHRDTRVDMGEYGVQKLNSAHALGGPALAVETVSQMAGVPISHYAEIDFDAFCKMVDALGGIEVDVPVDINDDEAGGTLHAGLQTLNGDQALVLCRSRHTYEGTAADPDMMRAANQRLVLSAIARKILDSDIGTIANAVSLMSSYVTTDLDLNDIIGLAQAMQGLDPETDIYSAMEPAEGVYEDGVWWTVTLEDEWRKMMERVDAGLPPTESGQIDEKTGTIIATAGGDFEVGEKTCWISVKNGTSKEGLAMSAVSLLNDAGFVNAAASSANSDDYKKTLIIYDDPANEYEAKQIAKALGQGEAMLNDGDWIYDGDFLVIIGADWNPNKGPSSSSASSGTSSGTGTGASSDTSSASTSSTGSGAAV